MNYFPMFMRLEKKRCLVAGGGRVAMHKTRQLLSFGAIVCVVSRTIVEELKDERVDWRQKTVSLEDLEGMELVVDATGDRQTGLTLSQACRERGIPVNVVDVPELCSFIFPAVYQKGDLCVAVSTSGASPTAAAWMRDRIAGQVPEGFDLILEQMRSLRQFSRENIEGQKNRSRFLKECFGRAIERDGMLSEREIEDILIQLNGKDAE